MADMEITVTVTDEDTIRAGLRMEWITATDEEEGRFEEATLCSGAGMGSAYLTFRMQRADGTYHQGLLDVRDLFSEWIRRTLEETS